MNRRRILRITFCAGLAAAWIHGQTPVERLQLTRSGTAGFCYERWTAEKDKVTEWSVPVTVVLPVGAKAGLYATSAPALSATLDAGASNTLSGMADVKIGGHALLFQDRCLLTAGASLPTGKASLETGEYSVASVLAMPVFQLRYPSLGQGLDLEAGLSGAAEVAGAVVGFGASFLKKGAYKPFKAMDQSFDPGDEASVSAGAEKEVSLFSRDVKFTADAMYSIYFDDRWGGKSVFRSGNRLLIQIQSAFRVEPFGVNLIVRDRIKAANRSDNGSEIALEGKNRNGNQFEMQGVVSRAPGAAFAWRGIAAFRKFSENDYGTGAATLYGIGAGLRKSLTSNAILDAEGRYFFGALTSGRKEVSASGLSLSGGVEIRL
jgi:hypothetical protein